MNRRTSAVRFEKHLGTTLPEGLEEIIALGQEREVLPYLGDVRGAFRRGRMPLERPGEAFVVGYLGNETFGFGAVMNELEDAFRLCRIHWVFVSPSHRGVGLGRKLVEALVQEASKSFDYSCNFDGLVGAEFWERQGFNRVQAPSATHWRSLSEGSDHDAFIAWIKKRRFRSRNGIV